jgi:hypothetical protein
MVVVVVVAINLAAGLVLFDYHWFFLASVGLSGLALQLAVIRICKLVSCQLSVVSFKLALQLAEIRNCKLVSCQWSVANWLSSLPRSEIARAGAWPLHFGQDSSPG